MDVSIYVKPNTNCGPLPLMTFEVGKVWEGESLILPFGPEGEEREVIGWCSLFGGSPCPIRVARVRAPDEGFLVWGGDWGVRILDDSIPPDPGEEHLPPGWGMPVVWVEDGGDLPPHVREVVDSED
jgi:hypothetical protein